MVRVFDTENFAPQDRRDAYIDAFVSSVKRRWPNVLLQWEDFAGSNAARLLARYRDQLCTFNDDIQGTAAVATATLVSAINITGVPLEDQEIVVFGFGTAGLGITNLLTQFMQDKGLTPEEARRRLYGGAGGDFLSVPVVEPVGPRRYGTAVAHPAAAAGAARGDLAECGCGEGGSWVMDYRGRGVSRAGIYRGRHRDVAVRTPSRAIGALPAGRCGTGR